MEEKQDEIDLKKLKGFFYSLYEVEEELGDYDDPNIEVITTDESYYIESLELRKEELELQINELLDKNYDNRDRSSNKKD